MSGNALYDPTADVVEFAFTDPYIDPVSGDWVSGSWEKQSLTTPAGTFTLFFARCLVGPGGVTTLAKGLYDVYCRITDNPEVPVLKTGALEVI